MEGDSWIEVHLRAVNESKEAKYWFVTTIHDGATVGPSSVTEVGT